MKDAPRPISPVLRCQYLVRPLEIARELGAQFIKAAKALLVAQPRHEL